MTRSLAASIGLLVGLAPALAQAQTNLDQGKTPAQIFANDCAACHKVMRGLASGKNSFMLAEFLREHYTTSREQAAALAAYVLRGGGAESPAPARGKASASGKAEEGTPATAKLQRPTDAEAKPEEDTGEEPPAEPTRRSERHERRPPGGAAARGRRKPPETAPVAVAPASLPPVHEPAAATAEPTPVEGPSSEPSVAPSAAGPASAEQGEGGVPRDNIPD